MNSKNTTTFKKFINYLQAYHPQHCQICYDLQRDLICQTCQSLWFEAVNPDFNISFTSSHTDDWAFYQKNFNRCPRCALILNIEHPFYKQKHTFCHDCDHTKFHFNRSFTLFDYIWPLQKLIHAVKSGNIKLLKNLSTHLAKNYLKFYLENIRQRIDEEADIHLIAYAPSPLPKIAQRGYNPSYLLAKNIERYFQQFLPASFFMCVDLFNINPQLPIQTIETIETIEIIEQKKLNQEQRFLALMDRYQMIDGFFENIFLGPSKKAKASKLQQRVQAIFPKNNHKKIIKLKILLVDDVMTTGATLNALSRLIIEEVDRFNQFDQFSQLDVDNSKFKLELSIENLILARAVSSKVLINDQE